MNKKTRLIVAVVIGVVGVGYIFASKYNPNITSKVANIPVKKSQDEQQVNIPQASEAVAVVKAHDSGTISRDYHNFIVQHSCHNCNLSGLINFPVLDKQYRDYQFSFSNLDGSNLSGTIFGCYKFIQSSFIGANLNNADLSPSNKDDVNGRDCLGTDINFNWSNFSNADMSWANLFKFQAEYANLSNVNFNNSDLSNADLMAADFSNSNFTDAILFGANLCRSNITPEQLSQAADYSCAMKPDCSGRYPSKDNKKTCW